jgi:hypothetical protein
MNRTIACLFALALGLLMSRCTTDFDLVADYEETMAIFGLLSQNDQEHFIRIHRGFVDKEISALVLAQDPDSLYYPDNLNITVTELSSGIVYPVERILGDTLNPPITKGTGVFANVPNVLYRFHANLNPQSRYRLRVENPATGLVTTAETPLVADFNVQRPFVGQQINLLAPTDFFVFWNLAANGRIHDLRVRYHYSFAAVNNPFVRLGSEHVDWQVFRNQDFTASQPRYDIPNELFFEMLDILMEPDPDHVRYFDSLTFAFDVGTEFLSDYINFNQAQTGITQDLATIQFTNVTNGYGILAARYHKEVTGIIITQDSRDSLACGSITGHLGFAPSNRPLKYPNYPFCNN